MIYTTETQTTLLSSKRNSLEKNKAPDLGGVNKSIQGINIVFDEFFSELSSPVFIPRLLVKGDLVRIEDYNYNLRNIYQDILSFYTELRSLVSAQIRAYNYSTLAVQEIKNRADSLASTVLDLNILNNLNRSDIIVAGDDFRNSDFIDNSAGTVSTKAELLLDGGGIGLAKIGLEEVGLDGTEVKITPLTPVTPGNNGVNTKPTLGNFERFYEGNYYNYLGLARPEGGRFNIRFISNPNERDFSRPDVPEGELHISSTGGKKLEGTDNPEGFFVDFGAEEEEKKIVRLKMFDKDPNTFWECEYLYKLPTSLFGDISDGIVSDGEGGEDGTESGVLSIDITQAHALAKNYDFAGRDLLIEIIISIKEEKNINFVAINPILFGSNVYPSIIEISTAERNSDQFILIDGWANLQFAKTLTPEANEFLTDSQLGLTLAPNRYDYKGQGIYPFPVRKAKKVKIVVSVPDPIAQIYDKTLVRLKKTIHIDGEIKVTTRRGLFG